MINAPLRILVVEDHQDTLTYLKLYLEQSGHAVVAARSVKQAVELSADSGCDVVLSDIALSDGTGWDLLNQLRLPRPVYAIAMSGFGTAADASRSKSAGFRHHLVKPIDPDRLDKLLEEARSERART